MDGDPRRMREYAHRLDRLPAALEMHHEQGVFAGAGPVHPGQAAIHPEPGLVELLATSLFDDVAATLREHGFGNA
jgi:hypothetical protein